MYRCLPEIKRLVRRDAERDGARDFAIGDYLAVYEERGGAAFADAGAIEAEIDDDSLLSGRELVRGGDGSALDADEVVVKSQLAREEVESPTVEAAALRCDYAFGASFGNLHLGADFERLVLYVRGLPSGIRTWPE